MFTKFCFSKGFYIALAALFLIFSNHIASFAGTPAASYEQTFGNKKATGEELANAFFDLLSKTGSPSGVIGTTAAQDAASRALVKPFLDPAFQLQRASGERYTAETYLPADVDEFKIGDVRETRPADDVVVVRYSVRATATLPDAALVMSKDKAPRITVFHWNSSDARWKILSHANFNTPVAAICNTAPLIDNGLKSPANSEDQALGQKLAQDWYSLAETGDLIPMLHPMVQLQTSGGQGSSTLSEYKPAKISKTEMDRLVVTRNENLLVLSLYARVSDTLLLDEKFGNTFTPRLYTFLKSNDGKWRIISSGYFNLPAKLPAGTACVPSGSFNKAP